MALSSSVDDLYIKGTKLYPEVDFQVNGKMKISGRIINDHLSDFFRPLFNWADKCNSPGIRVEVDLDYLNSNGTFLLVELFKRLENNSSIHNIDIIWIYEEEDEEHYELGEIIREKLDRSCFNYLSYA